MNIKRLNTQLGLGGVLAVIAALVVLAVNETSAESSTAPFAAIPSVGNIQALNNAAIPENPSSVRRVPESVNADSGKTHSAGAAGYIWQHGSDVCTLMSNDGPGGCFARFDKPVVLYLWGDSQGFHVGGIVPDTVRELTLDTSIGNVSVVIEENGYYSELPVGASINGEYVTLTDGQSFYLKDPVRVLLPK
jgi:hypothetical protein